ncbi:MAG: hypothetical protein LBB80_03495 [Treponema sp.]|nr:hypothetical protein [Treponema sp.]
MAGLLGISPEDERLFRGCAMLAELQAQGKGFPLVIKTVAELPLSWHPNSLVLELYGAHTLIMQGSSIGSGSIQIDAINGYGVHLSGESEAILVLHYDEIGVIAEVTHILAAHHINIAATSSHRKERGARPYWWSKLTVPFQFPSSPKSKSYPRFIGSSPCRRWPFKRRRGVKNAIPVSYLF